MMKADLFEVGFCFGILLTPPPFGHPLSEGEGTPPAFGHPLKRGKRGTGILLWGDYLILSVERTFLMSFFKAEAAAIVSSKAAKGKATPALKEGVVIVESNDWAILGMMK